MKGRVCLVLACISAALFISAPARAGLELCNKTSYVLYAAAGYQAGTSMITQGWTRIVPGSCSKAIKERLTATRYYVYAKNALAHAGASRAWGGNTPLCIKEGQFSLRNPVNSACKSDEGFAVPFAEVDTRRKNAWTMNFNDNPPLRSMVEAQLAGVKRLMRDNGAKVAAIDGKPDKAIQAPLNAFRKRMRLSDLSTNDDLFDALETEALKVTAPAGYAICNDSDEILWAAQAQGTGQNLTTRGWWKIAAGACARTIATPLKDDKIYLLVEKKGGAPLVTGLARFCVAGNEFEIKGQGRCKDRGLMEKGFALTNVKELAGYIARVDEDGLSPPGRIQTRISK